MSSTDEFLKYCSQTLEADFGPMSNGIINKVQSKKNLNATSNIRDFEEFIDQIESSIRVISGKNNAVKICNTLRIKAIELNISKEAMDIINALRTEALKLNIGEFLGKINIMDVCALSSKATETTETQKSSDPSMNNNIEEFLMKNTLPTEGEITRYAANLALEHGSDAKNVEKYIIEKVKFKVKNAFCRKAIREEINRFLIEYPEPTKTDVDDFVSYICLFGFNFHEDELRQHIEKERLYRKFREPQDEEDTSQLDQLVDIIKTYDDKRDIDRAMQEKDFSYLFKDESGISDKLLFEFVELVMLIEKNTLEGLYLKRKFKKIRSDGISEKAESVEKSSTKP